MNPTLHTPKYCWSVPTLKGLRTKYLLIFLIFSLFTTSTTWANRHLTNDLDDFKTKESAVAAGPIVCNDLLNFTLNHACEAGISVNLLLENPASGANIYYILQLFHQNGDSLGTPRLIGNPTNGTSINDLNLLNIYGNTPNEVLTVGEQITYDISRFTSTMDNGGNTIEVEENCWGYLLIEDKNGPICRPALEEELLVNYDLDCDGLLEENVNDPSGIDDLKNEYILCSLLDANGVSLYFDILEAEDADLNGNGIFGEAGIDVVGDFTDCSAVTSIYFEETYWQICSLEDAEGLPIDESRFDAQTFEIIEVYQRTWFAIDDLGHQSSQGCSQYVFGLRPKANQVILEESAIASCETGEADIAPYFIVNNHIENNGTGSDGPTFSNDKPYFLKPNQTTCKYAVSFHEDAPTITCSTGYQKLRHWTVTNCCNNNLIFDEFTQLIEVRDDVAPNIWLDADQDGIIDVDTNGDPILAQGFMFTVNTSFFNCSSDGDILTLLTSDNCTPDQANIFNVTIEKIPLILHDQSFFINEFPNGGNLVTDLNDDAEEVAFSEGQYLVTYYAQDDCGNVSTATLRMIIEDERPPVAICNDELHVTLTNFNGNLLARIYPEDLDDSSHDNCHPLGYLVRSNDNVSTADNTWHPYVEFSCEDIENEDLKVELLVFEDRNEDGNFIDVINNNNGFSSPDGIDDIDGGLSATCWGFVTVEDKSLPLISCEDKSIECDDPNLEALRQNFLSIDTDHNGVADAYYCPPTLSSGCPSYEEANLVLEVIDITYDASCHYGTFVRRWTYTKYIDGQARTATCDQIITVNYHADWTMTFPTDVVIECTPEMIEIPAAASIDEILINDGCSSWGMEVAEETFDVVGEAGEGACFKIIRTYTFINDCTWDPTNTELAIVNRPEGLLLNNPIQLRHRSDNFGYNDFGDENDDDPYNEIISALDITAAFLPPFPTPTNIANDDGAMVLMDNDFNVGDDPQGTLFLYQRQYNERINNNDQVVGVYAENYGYFAYRQTIKITDTQAPVISSIENMALCDTSGLCGQEIILCAPQVEECRATYSIFYTIKDENETTVAAGEFPVGASPTDCVNAGFLPLGNYRVTYRVADGCGNLAIENFQLTISDCKAPLAYCIYGQSVDLNSDGRVILWAEDFDGGSVDACCEPISFSFNEAGDSTSVQFSCDDIGSNLLDIWVTDACGNSAFCSTYIVVESNPNNDGSTSPFECEDIGSRVPIAGFIRTQTGEAAEHVAVRINSADNTTEMSNEEGFYSAFLNIGNDYTIEPENNTNPLNGVTTLDLILIKKHILGLAPLTNPYQLIAADVNRSNSISTLDMVQLRKLILNIDQEISNNRSWRFIPTAYVFPSPQNPWIEVFPELININDLAAAQHDLNFVAVKIGDVNGSSIPNLAVQPEDRKSKPTWWLTVEEQALKANEIYEIEVKAKDLQHVAGYQLTLQYETSLVDFVKIKEGLATEENFGIFEEKGQITTSWTGKGNDDEVLFSLVLKAKENGWLSEALTINSSLTAAEAYRTNSEVLKVQLQFDQQMPFVMLYQNTPNPFSDKTMISFSLPETMSVQVSIMDVTGKVFYKKEDVYEQGYQSFEIEASQLSSGLSILSLKTKYGVVTKKMMIVEK